MSGPIRARARVAIASLTLGLALLACGDDDPTGPVDVDIAGDWVMDATGTDNAGTTCQFSDLTLSFVRVDEVVEGTIEFGGADTLVCTPGFTGDADGVGPLEDIVENGRDVQFTFEAIGGTWSVSGAFTGNGNSMSGDVTFPVSFASGSREFSGSWTATRS